PLEQRRKIAEERSRAEFDGAIRAISTAIADLTTGRAGDVLKSGVYSGVDLNTAARLSEPHEASDLLRLMDRYWSQEIRLDVLLDLDDPLIIEQAKSRLFDDPRASRLLACKGEPSVKEFMMRLLRQGHGDGARWAAAAHCVEARQILIDTSPRADPSAVLD